MERKPHPDDWRPLPGPQTRFLSLTCFEALYGGAAGGGKSDALLVDAARYIGRGHGGAYHALLLRRTFPELEASLIKRSWDLYPRLGGRYNEQKKIWKFPAGELVQFGHVQHESDVFKYQGDEFQFVGFDELTSFAKSQYIYLFSRVRSSRGVPCRVRAATNPGNEGHEWVFERFGAWLDPESKKPVDPSKVAYFLRCPDEVERMMPKGTPGAKGRTFVPARLEDNPYLFADGQYEAVLNSLDPVSRARLRNGNWLIKPARGIYFNRTQFRFEDAAPAVAQRIRYWDRAATEAKPGTDPDWTVGVRLARTGDGQWWVEDVVRMRGNPGQVEAVIRSTAELDGKAVTVGLEQEPGASGVSEIAYLTKALEGFHVRPNKKRVDKIVSAGPVSAQVFQHNVHIVRGPWNEAFVSELEQFPEGSHDDQVDGLSGGFSLLAGSSPATLTDFRRFMGQAPRARF
jgi:predicted phage terminase large subunit-like protein